MRRLATRYASGGVKRLFTSPIAGTISVIAGNGLVDHALAITIFVANEDNNSDFA